MPPKMTAPVHFSWSSLDTFCARANDYTFSGFFLSPNQDTLYVPSASGIFHSVFWRTFCLSTNKLCIGCMTLHNENVLWSAYQLLKAGHYHSFKAPQAGSLETPQLSLTLCSSVFLDRWNHWTSKIRVWEPDAADTSGLRMGGAVGDLLAPMGWGLPRAQEAEKEVGLRRHSESLLLLTCAASLPASESIREPAGSL